MKFAFVGESPMTQTVLDALAAHPEHSVTHIAGFANAASVLSRHPGIRDAADWQALLSEPALDAVIVSGDEDQALPPARQLAAAGCPLVVIPSPGQSSAFAYELSLVRDDNLVPLYPLLPHRLDPAAARLQREIRDLAAAGNLRQLRLERIISTPDGLLETRRDVEPCLLPDADLLRWLGGSFTQVTAIHQGHEGDRFATAQVSLAGNDAIDTTWILSTGPRPEWQLTARTADGQIVLEHRDGVSRILRDGQPVEPDNGTTQSTDSDWTAQLADAIAAFLQADTDQQTAAWTDFTRAHEIVDGHRRSIRRRRTIDLHFETLSERSQFKTQMAAMGCGVLTWTLFGLVAYLAIANMFAPGDGATPEHLSRYRLFCRIGFALWILPLVLFLAAQLLLVITRPAIKPASKQATADAD